VTGPAGPRVLDLSTGVAGAYTCLLLSYAGADVARGEPAGGDPLRRWRQGFEEAPGDGALFEYLRQGQTALTSDGSFDPLGADIIITSPDPSQAQQLRAVVDAHPGLIAVSFTPYGLEGPFADRPASDLTVEADSGGLAIRGPSDRAPYQMGGRTCEWLAGAYAAAATMALWHGRRRGGAGGLIDLSQAELLHAAASNYMDVFHAVAHAEDGGADADPTGPPRSLETPSIEKSSDGWVGFNTNSPHQIAGFLNMMGRPDLAASGEYGTASKRIGRIAEWQQLVTAWTSRHTSAEIIALAEANGVPVAPVSDSRSVAELDQVIARGTLVTAPSGRFQMPGQPWRIDGGRGPELGAAPAVSSDQQPTWRSSVTTPAVTDAAKRPLEGLRVLDLTTWWAGPSATAFLAALGADVIHVEAPARMDGARMVGAAFLPRPQFWELSNFFLTVNVNKRDLAIDLTTDRGRELFLELVAQSDVVVENATPRVMDKLKLGWDVIHAANPQAILTRMPAYGLDGPWRERPGFAQNIEQASGLAWLTGEPSDQPRIQRGPADPNGGMHAAFATLAALEQRERTGEGSLVESSLFDAALAIAAELVIEWSAYQNPLLRIGNRSVTAAPQGVYACIGDDDWLAITVATDEQWRALVDLLDRAELKAPELATEAGRRAQHDLLDSVLAEWSAKHEIDDAVATLLDAGIPAAQARDPRLAARNPQFRHRGYHQLVEHPVAGVVPIPTLPYRISGEPWIRTPSPTLGQHNQEILTDLLGLTQDDIDQLTADGVIATAPKF
jgi:crotonobetainyl-CoA:carnitine CoA-transferase CaiB-like acyl-CoA transferase